MDLSIQSLWIALPEVFLLCAVCTVLLVDVFLPTRLKHYTYYLIQATLVLAFLLTLPQFTQTNGRVLAFEGHYVLDRLATLSKLFIFGYSIFAFAYARAYARARQDDSQDSPILGLFAVIGMTVMVSGGSLLSIYLGLELLSLPLYAMVALNKNLPNSAEAAMKYFVLGALASGILLYGMSLLYGLTSSLDLMTIGRVLQQQNSTVPLVALVFLMAGLLFKFGAVPFHMWVPDVYQGAATPTTLFIASAPKIAAFAITVRLLAEAMQGYTLDWSHILIAVSILSMMIGNVLAIAQTNLKRMLAYSSIGHIGYALLGVLAGPYSANGYSAAMFYIAMYVLVAAGAFAVIAILSNSGTDFDELVQYRGLNARNPWLAFMMLLFLFSMAGVPPTVGFFAKLGLLESLVEAHLTWLAVLALIFALIGAYYYLRVVMLMYFQEPEEAHTAPIRVSKDMLIAISVNGVAALVLGVLPSALIDLCRISVG